jgi:hypothetical protein
MRRIGLLGTTVVAFTWLPIVLLVGFGTWYLGVRVLALGAAVAIVLWLFRPSALRVRPQRPFVQLVVVSLVLGVLGGISFGGPGVIFGLAVGTIVGLFSAYDLELKNNHGVLAPLDPLDPVQEATLGKALGFLFTVPLFGALVVLIWVAVSR